MNEKDMRYRAQKKEISTAGAPLLLGEAGVRSEGGDAVFIARYMLDIDENQLTADFAKAPAAKPNSMESRANMAKLYPNPAKDEVMIAFEKATDSQGVLEIYGFTGSVIQSQNLASGYQYISVSVKDLKPGIYFYRILINNEVVAKDKLLIVK
jgi:hypothetical protein